MSPSDSVVPLVAWLRYPFKNIGKTIRELEFFELYNPQEYSYLK